MFPNFPDSFTFFLEGSHASHIFPYGKRNIQIKMTMEHWWNCIDREKPEVLGGKFRPMPLCLS